MEPHSTVALTFVGGGVLATSIIDGLQEHCKTTNSDGTRYNIRITARREEHVQELHERYPDLLITTNNRDPRLWKASTSIGPDHGICEINGSTASKDIIFICTQPQFTSAVCEDIRAVMKMWPGMSCPIIVTMCPGITMHQLQTWLKQQVPVVRTMPNTPVSERQGATAMVANSLVSEQDIKQVMNVFRPISPAVCLLPHESLIDVSASISG